MALKLFLFSSFLAISALCAPIPRAFPCNSTFWTTIDEKGKTAHPAIDITGTKASGDGWELKIGRHGNVEGTRTPDGAKFAFREGFLSEIAWRDGSRQTFQPLPSLEGTLKELFPNDEDVLAASTLKPTDIWSGGGRLAVFYGNPNKTAVVFVLLAIVSAWVAGKAGGSGVFWRKKITGSIILAISVCVLGFSAWGLVATLSRGGFVSLVVGLGVLAGAWAVRRASLKTVGWLVLSLATLAVLLFSLPGAERFSRQLFSVDESNLLRLNILKAVPKMMHDAPFGWGWGQSGIAYMTWYRPLNDLRELRALVSSHFTWLVEMGWHGRFVYFFAWAGILAAAIRAAKYNALPLALLTAFGVAMFFNHVGEEWTLWMCLAVPCLAALPSIVKAFPWKKFLVATFAAAAVFSGLACFTFYGLGGPSQGEATIRKTADGDLVIVNEKSGVEPVYIVSDTYAVGGWAFVGKELLGEYVDAESCEELPPAAMTDSLEDLPPDMQRLVLTGRACEDYVKRISNGLPVPVAESILMISPSIDVSEIPPLVTDGRRFRAVIGSLVSPRMRKMDSLPSWLRVVRGAELYIPGWIQVALRK